MLQQKYLKKKSKSEQWKKLNYTLSKLWKFKKRKKTEAYIERTIEQQQKFIEI